MVSICQSCGRPAETKYVVYYRNIGAVIINFSKQMKGYLCRDCSGKYFWRYTLTTLVLGWWGVISFFITWFVLANNVIRYLGTLGLRRPAR